MVKRPHRVHANTLEAEIQAFQQNISFIEPPVELPDHLKPLWHQFAIERAVAEWSTPDLYQLVELVETIHDRSVERRKFRREAKVNRGPHGPIANPRGKVIDQMTAKIGRLMRALLLDARANGYKIDRVANQRQLEREVRARTDPVQAFLDAGGDPMRFLLGGDDNENLAGRPPASAGREDEALQPIIKQIKSRGNGKRPN